jgi:hypothetical protein
MFNLPNKDNDYIKEGLAREEADQKIQTFTEMLDDILDDYIDGRVTKNTMEDMMMWCLDMLEKAKEERDG